MNTSTFKATAYPTKSNRITKRNFLVSALALSAAGLSTPLYAQTAHDPKTALVIVSLADNKHQGIVPTTDELGNGQDPSKNLYWGAMYGVKTYFKRSENYITVDGGRYDHGAIKGLLDSVTIKPKDNQNITINAIAIDGMHQQEALALYYTALQTNRHNYDLVVFIGHNPLMDINLKFNKDPRTNFHTSNVKTAVLACQSRPFFKDIITDTKAQEYVMTNGNMAPEAYSLDGILTAWINDEPASVACQRAAEKYAQYQKIPLKNAKWLFNAS